MILIAITDGINIDEQCGRPPYFLVLPYLLSTFWLCGFFQYLCENITIKPNKFNLEDKGDKGTRDIITNVIEERICNEEPPWYLSFSPPIPIATAPISSATLGDCHKKSNSMISSRQLAHHISKINE